MERDITSGDDGPGQTGVGQGLQTVFIADGGMDAGNDFVRVMQH